MTQEEAVLILRNMYSNAPRGDKVTMIHLFGINYATELVGLHVATIAERATGHRSYGTEIAKGMKLARYVQVRNDNA